MSSPKREERHESWHTCGPCSGGHGGGIDHDYCEERCQMMGCPGGLCECPCMRPLTKNETMRVRRFLEAMNG